LEKAEREISKPSGGKASAARGAGTIRPQHLSGRSQESTNKPRLFIASSSDNLEVAYDLQLALGERVAANVWDQGAFRLSLTNIESLVEQVRKSDFGAFILAPSDMTEIKTAHQKTVRDNVIFELGLFIGGLGRERCFLVVPSDVTDLHLPTDVLGVTAASYDPQRHDNMVASLGPAAHRIRKEIMRVGPR